MLRVSLAECFADHLVDCLRSLTLDLASVLMHRGALNFGLAERRTAGGATELVLGEGVDIAALDRQLRAALGAAGFKLPERDVGGHEASLSDDWNAARDQRAKETACFRGGMRGLEKGLGTLDACRGPDADPKDVSQTPRGEDDRTGGSEGTPFTAEQIERWQRELMLLFSGHCPSRRPRCAPGCDGWTRARPLGAGLLLLAGALLPLHAMGRRFWRKNR